MSKAPEGRHTSVESTINSVWILPHGTSGITPDQVPANLLEGAGLGLETGFGFGVDLAFDSDSTGFAFSSVFVDFAFSVGAGVGLSGTS